ncbi:MAG TPA: Crp/Fnr family transcriptional regulator [Vicinamibacterales bacterium]|nr:Crp/Fnr family transcriptional regulator [Vicinamibacterales bacterium]
MSRPRHPAEGPPADVFARSSAREPDDRPLLRIDPPNADVRSDPLQTLTDEQRATLGRISTRTELPRGAILYEQGSPADAVFILTEGTAKAFRQLATGKRRIVAFLCATDLIGLAEGAVYVNSVQAVTRCVVHRIPVPELTAVLHDDPRLQYQFLRRIAHELRDAQRQIIITGRRDATGRLAMFLSMLERDPCNVGKPGEIALTMTRSDIADYLGLSLEAVSRAGRELRDSGLVEFTGRSRARILDRERFERLVNDV